MKASEVIANLQRRFPNEPEYIQAVSQVLGTIEEEYNKHPEFEKANLIERLCIPDRIIQFRVSWVDDKATYRLTWVTAYSTTTRLALQGRSSLPQVSKLGYFEVLGFRADIQELSYYSPNGWC